MNQSITISAVDQLRSTAMEAARAFDAVYSRQHTPAELAAAAERENQTWRAWFTALDARVPVLVLEMQSCATSNKYEDMNNNDIAALVWKTIRNDADARNVIESMFDRAAHYTRTGTEYRVSESDLRDAIGKALVGDAELLARFNEAVTDGDIDLSDWRQCWIDAR